MIAGSGAAWPAERSRRRDRSDRMRSHDARVRAEMLDAVSLRRGDHDALVVTRAWLDGVAETGERLPDRDALDEAVASSLRSADLSPAEFGVPDRRDPSAAIDEAAGTAALLGLSVVELLRDVPNERVWRVLFGLSRRGRRLEVAIDEALGDALRREQGFRGSVVALARRMVERAVDDPLNQVAAFERETFAAMISEWKAKPDLLELWFGLRGLSYVRYDGSEIGILREIARFDVPAFVSLLERFPDPHPVATCIAATDASFRFETWRGLVDAAPTAFEGDGTWNGSTILPILMGVAGEALAGTAGEFWREENDAVLETASLDVREAARDVASVLLGRGDGPAALLRWGAWSARSLASRSGEGRGVPANVGDHAFASLQMLSAIGDAVGPDLWTGMTPSDLEPAEAWFSLMARIMATAQTPANAERHGRLLGELLSWWPDDDDHDTWRTERGIRLREAASVLGSLASRPGEVGMRILAVPMGMAEDPSSVWSDMWNRCRLLREEVEFGRRGSSDEAEAQATKSAADLLRIAADLGLCTLDQVVDERIEVSCDRESAVDGLVTGLWEACSEMLLVDRFGSEWWSDLRRRLVVRRILCFEGGPPRPDIRRSRGRSAPTLVRMLGDAAAVDRSFVSILLGSLENGMSAQDLRSALVGADVDPVELIAAVERMNEVDDRRPICDTKELTRLRDLVA